MDRVRVLVLGGYGFFGRRLVERLLLQPGLEIIVAGRSAQSAEALVQSLSASGAAALRSCVLDAGSATLAQQLAALAPAVVVHTAGPFQGQDHRVARACITARCHYIDLADGRAFVQGIGALHADALAAGVAVLSGASSVPALSSAVVDDLASGMACVESIDIGISPGNRTERGLSTVAGVLSYCGQPIAADGGTPVRGWSGAWSHDYPAPVGRRLLSPCDVPDLGLLPSRYPGRPSVRFGAGLEVRALHRVMNAMAWMARVGIVKDWSRHAAVLKRMSEAFLSWGSDAGAMHVTVRGRDDDGVGRTREWSLVAERGDGPFVPTLAAAALVRRIAAGLPPTPGARPCMGEIGWQAILAEAQGLAITAGETSRARFFDGALGEAYQRLDAPVRAFHDLRGRAELHGEVETEAPAGALAALVGRLLGTPQASTRGALRFELHCDDAQQTWTRHFPHRTMRSRMRVDGSDIVETLGPVRLVMRLQESGGSLHMVLRSMHFLGIPCPGWLLPRIEAREHGAGGRMHFHVRAALPVVRQVAGYHGWLEVPRA